MTGAVRCRLNHRFVPVMVAADFEARHAVNRKAVERSVPDVDVEHWKRADLEQFGPKRPRPGAHLAFKVTTGAT